MPPRNPCCLLNAHQPPIKMATLAPNLRKTDLQNGQVPHERFFIAWDYPLDSLGRCRLRGVIYLFRRRESSSNRAQPVHNAWVANRIGKSIAITKEQRLKLVHEDERDESTLIKALAHVVSYVPKQGLFNGRCPLLEHLVRCTGSTRPSTVAALGQAVIVHHSGGDTTLVLFQVGDDVLSNDSPRTNTPAPRPRPRIAYQSGIDARVSAPQEVRAKHLVDERLLSLPLHMNQETRHSASCPSGMGLPPNSFFSQSCPKLYRPNHD